MPDVRIRRRQAPSQLVDRLESTAYLLRELAIPVREDDQRQNLYGACLRTALRWLFDAQRTTTDHARE